MYSPDFPRVHKEPIRCGNHAAPQCRDCTEGQSWGYSQWCNGQCVWLDGSCRNKLDRVHDTHNRQNEPIDDLGHGLHSQCVLEETGKAQKDTAPFIPDVATTRLQLDQNSKIIAFTLLGEHIIYDRACYSTQIKDISVCLERTAEDSLMFTNQMRIRSELDNQVQEELSSNCL